MGKHHILCVHGIGSHNDDWINATDDGGQSFKELFFEVIDRYPNAKSVLDGQIVLHAIHYDDHFETVIDSWQTHLDTLLSFAPKHDLMKESQAYVGELVAKAKQAQDTRAFWRTHIMDLVLFAGLGTIKEPVLIYVAKQILEHCVDAGPHDRYSVIGHSMGTSVVEKALKKLWNEGVDGETLEGNVKFRSVCLIANCAYTLSRDKQRFYQSEFKPTGDTLGLCDYLFSINHRLDPVGQFLPFDPDSQVDWLPPEDELRYRNIELKRLSSPNVHSINHYFRDPAFHIPYLRMLCGEPVDPGAGQGSVISSEQAVQAQTDFVAKTPLGAYKSAYSDLQSLDVKNAQTFQQFYESVKAMLALKDSFKAGIGA